MMFSNNEQQSCEKIKRLVSLRQIMHRYAIMEYEIPVEWIEEFNELTRSK
jgi:hypothetical protein